MMVTYFLQMKLFFWEKYDILKIQRLAFRRYAVGTGACMNKEKNETRLFLLIIVVFAVIIRFTVAYLTVHHFDLSYYNDWSRGAAADLFGAYDNIPNLDYPPLFLFPLVLTGKLLQIEALANFGPYEMLLLKGWQVLCDVLLVFLFYLLYEKHNRFSALMASTFWALNPAMLVNSSYWGQTDSIMMAFLLVSFWLILERWPVWASVFMALGCLMKFQTLYFTPLFGLALVFGRFSLKKVLTAAGAGAAVIVGVFLPFVLRSGWDLPLRVYFGGYDRYPGASVNAFNLYGALGLNYFHLDNQFPVLFSLNAFSWCMLILAVALAVYLYFTAEKPNVWLIGFLLMQTIFLFTARMHERYQVPAMLFLLAAWIIAGGRALLVSFCGLTMMIFLNQFLVMEYTFYGDSPQAWMVHYDELVIAFSWVNVLLYAVTAVFSLKALYKGGRRPFLQTLRASLPYAGRPARR